MTEKTAKTCLREDGLWYGVHDIFKLENGDFECWWCHQKFIRQGIFRGKTQ